MALVQMANYADDVVERVQRIQIVTIAWMVIEAAGSLLSAWMAGSAVLLAFGGDSAIELISAIVVLRRFRMTSALDREEKLAACITGSLLMLLGGIRRRSFGAEARRPRRVASKLPGNRDPRRRGRFHAAAGARQA
jgi:hypothetical protein